MKEEIDTKAVQPPKVEQEIRTPTRISLNSEECDVSRLCEMHKSVPFTDYSKEPAEELVYDIVLKSVSIDERKKYMRRCTKTDRSGIPEVDWELLEEMITAATLGLTFDEWERFKKTHPHGLYMKLILAAKEINGELTLTKEQVESLKNMVGQE